MYTLKAW